MNPQGHDPMLQTKRTGGLSVSLQYLFFFLFLLSVVCSWRAVSSLSLAALLFTGLLTFPGLQELKRDQKQLQLMGASLLYLLILCCGYFFTADRVQFLKHMQMSSGILLIPITLAGSQNFLDRKKYFMLMRALTLMVVGACIYCLLIAVSTPGDSNRYFYHELVSPLRQHAVRFSIIVFIVLCFLWSILAVKKQRIFNITCIIILSVFLFLLSSKLVLVFYLFSIPFLLSGAFPGKRKNIALIAILLLLISGTSIFLTNNPVQKRFELLVEGDEALYQRDQFDQGIYFNGIQFRLLQWRLVPRLLGKNDAWWTGVTAGDAQKLLNQEYIQRGMYTGQPGTKDQGLLDYHTHNQFLQSLLMAGIPGLLGFSILFFCVMRLVLSQRETASILLVILLFLHCFTDAILETQYGIILFSFFPLFSYISLRFKEATARETRATILKETAFLP